MADTSEPEPLDFAALAAAWTKIFAELSRAFNKLGQDLVEAFRPLTELLREHPELLVREEGPDTTDCDHLCVIAPEHECTGEATTTVRYAPHGRDVPVCQPCFDVVTAHAVVARHG
jgi:hypothetical protein